MKHHATGRPSRIQPAIFESIENQMGSTTLPQESLIGDHAIDAYFIERSNFRNLGKSIAEIIRNTVSDEQLDDIKTQLLMLAIQTQQDGASTHCSALLVETIAKIHEYQRKRQV